MRVSNPRLPAENRESVPLDQCAVRWPPSYLLSCGEGVVQEPPARVMEGPAPLLTLATSLSPYPGSAIVPTSGRRLTPASGVAASTGCAEAGLLPALAVGDPTGGRPDMMVCPGRGPRPRKFVSRVVRSFLLRGTSGPFGLPYLDPLSRAPPTRLELATFRSTTGCSGQLSYGGVVLVTKVVQKPVPMPPPSKAASNSFISGVRPTQARNSTHWA
jgi:hypothetical protein